MSKATSKSNAAGVMPGARGLSRGTTRANGMMAEGSGGGSSNGVRQNGTMPGNMADQGGDKYLGPKASTNQDFRPNKKGGAR